MQMMGEEERELFDMDNSIMSQRMFMYNYMHGLKRYTLNKESNDQV